MKIGKHSSRLRSLRSQKLYRYLFYIFLYIIFIPIAESYVLSIGHLPPLKKGDSFLFLTDLSGLGPSVKISFYNESGKEVSVSNKLLPPQGKIQLNIKDHIKSAGTIVVDTPNDQIMGEYWQFQGKESISTLYLQPSSEEERYFVNCFQMPFCDQTIIVISDPYGNGPMVQMEFYGKSGELIRIARKLIRPHGLLAVKASEYAPTDILSKVSVRSFGGGITVHRRHICHKKSFLMPASKPYRDFMIYFSNEKKNLRNLTVIDTSANGANVNIKLINQSGELAYDLNITLTPGSGTLVNLSGYIDEINNGVIRIISSSEIIADYWESDLDSGSLILDTGINYRNKQFLCSTYFSLYKNMNFELFLLNIGKEISKVEIQFYNSNGERIGTKKITLGTYRDFSQLLDHYFKGVILGTLIIKESTSELLATTIITDANNRLLGKAAVY